MPYQGKFVYSRQLIDERFMSTRFELTGGCAAVNLTVAYAPTGVNPNLELKEVFWKTLGRLVKLIRTKAFLFVLIDTNARTGWKGAITVGCLEHMDLMS